MKKRIATLIDEIADLPEDWHGAGSMRPRQLAGIATLAGSVGRIHHSVETGSGKTTLLFSHLSDNHLVFAVDDGNSITQVRSSPLFNGRAVKFVEGPTQLTLPCYNFTDEFQIVLIDGPHGYPFPDMEYYYFYQRVTKGGLLLLDDIHIPSVGRMFEIIKADAMFELLDVIHHMACFRRTSAPLLDPLADGWWTQGYNRPLLEKMKRVRYEPRHSKLAAMLRRVSPFLPQAIKRAVPIRIKQRIWK